MTSGRIGFDRSVAGGRLMPALALAAMLIAAMAGPAGAQMFTDQPPPVPPATVPDPGGAISLAPPSGPGSGPNLPTLTLTQPSIAAVPPAAASPVAPVPNVAAGDVALLPEGTYYIISNYGDANSVVRSDIRVQASKLTDVIISHRAAVITLKLVGDKGGEALANTAWSVITPGGDVIKESIGAFPRVVLSEGEYRAIAKNEGKVIERHFNMLNGVDRTVSEIAR